MLIGDSITHFWGGEPRADQANGPKAFASVFAPYRVLNLGFGWDRTQNVLWRLDRGEFDGLHPRIVVIHIGTNNTSQTEHARQNTAAEIVEGIAAICGRVRSKTPGARIILMQVMPREEKPDNPRRTQIAEINRLLVEFARANHLDLLDLAPKLLKPDGTLPRSLMPDFCHPNEAGYMIWADALRPLLTSKGWPPDGDDELIVHYLWMQFHSKAPHRLGLEVSPLKRLLLVLFLLLFLSSSASSSQSSSRSSSSSSSSSSFS